ncbi:DUF4386 domain-containing protein [Antribacter gilvus]|uniref:DUF4386 domain-containing protein n=1 Tax=Antribacter gilvus TaxID=2304675 RepID=UPI000F774CD3|nr:DUF4386 domain-containing protein [Antribacter gilvus]
MEPSALVPRTARTTGLLYLAMAIVAVPGFLVIRPLLFDPSSSAATLDHLVANEGLARVGIALELALVAVQALVALWFYRLFRRTDAFAAGSLAAFGMVNAVAILGSAACLAAALDTALTPAGAADAAGAVQVLYVLGGSFWGVGALFFGLWLVPMGFLALRSGMPRALGVLVIAGGVGYVASAFVTHLAPGAALVGDLLSYVATIGELWMIGWLLWYSFRAVPAPAEADAGAAPAPSAQASGA